jgi:stress-induced morphogen
MDLKEKVEKALRSHFRVEHIKLVDDNGISGFVVSPDFLGVDRPERRTRVARALRDPSMKLTRREQHRVLVIAPFTPVEYDLYGLDGEDEVDSRDDSETSEGLAALIPKVEHLLRSRFRVYVLHLKPGDGIYGFVVSPDFEGLSSHERQDLLRRAFRDPSSNLTDCERRRITFISTSTPAEYEAKLELDSLD